MQSKLPALALTLSFILGCIPGTALSAVTKPAAHAKQAVKSHNQAKQTKRAATVQHGSAVVRKVIPVTPPVLIETPGPQTTDPNNLQELPARRAGTGDGKDGSNAPLDGGTPKVTTSTQAKKQADKSAETVHNQNPEVQQQIKNEIAEPKLETTTKVDPSSATGVTTTVEKRATLGIALGGGGARGAAHIGVLRVLEREQIPIDLIVGNSMGSIVGGLYSTGVSLDKITAALADKSLRKAYLPGMIPPKLLLSPFMKMAHPFKKHYAGLFSGQKFEDYLSAMMPDPNQTFEQNKIRFSAVATNLIDGKAYTISKGKVATAIHASAAISPLLAPVPMEDKLYVDGGVRANLPAFSAREAGVNIVIAVLVDEPLLKEPPQTFFKLKSIAMRQADIVLAINDEHQLQYADIVINPDVSGISILSSNPEDVRRAIIAGEKAAEMALPDIRKMLANPPAPKTTGVAGQSALQ